MLRPGSRWARNFILHRKNLSTDCRCGPNRDENGLRGEYLLGMSDVTRLIHQIQDGDQAASAELLPLVYDELRKLAAAKMANERIDHTLAPTALVHEAYVRLVDVKKPQQWNGRCHRRSRH